MERNWNRQVRLSAIIFLIPILFSFSVTNVMAEKPIILDITWYMEGTRTILEITFRQKDYDSFQLPYVDEVEVKVDESTYSIPCRQGTEIYTVYYDLGEVTGEPTVQARAHDTEDGWGEWSSPVVVPEFPLIPTVLLFAALAMLVVALRMFAWKRL